MQTNKLVFLGVILWLIPGAAFAQNSSNSPYTYYGYGMLADKAFISQRGMGGIGLGLRNKELINPMNPASFSAVDSMTFMFDVGITAQRSWFYDGVEREQRFNGYLENLALQFLLARKLGFGAGFEQISKVGYQFADTTQSHIDDTQAFHIYRGNGGLSRVYGALSYDFMNKFSVGAKLSYLFGDIVHDNLVTFNSASVDNSNLTDTVRAYGLLYDFGIQFRHPVGRFKSVTIGAVYSPKTRFGAKVMRSEYTSNPSTGVIQSIQHTVSRDSVFEMPESFGLGFTYNELGKITVGADVSYQRWANAKYYNQANVFDNRLKLNAGGELIPDHTGSSFLKRTRYRAGLSYANSYLIVRDLKYKEYGAYLGFGIPLPDRRTDQRSYLNLSFEYSIIRPESRPLHDEQYFRVSLSYTFNERWFFKQRLL
jgi:hypothetical protein